MKFTKLALATLVLATAGNIAVAKDILRFSSFEPPVAHVTKNILTPWANEVNAASGGELDVQIFPGGTLGRNPAQQLKLVEDGVADIAWVIPGYTPGRFNQGTVAELPFLVPNGLVGSTAMWKLYEDGIFKGDYEKFKMIGIMTSFPNGLATTMPVTVPTDLKGHNLRAPGPTMLTAIKTLEAVPVGGITGPGLAEAINRGLIDGTFTQFGAMETFRVGGAVSNYVDLPLGATPMLIVMNKAKYESLSDKAKAAIDAFSGADFSERFGASFDQNVTEARGRLLDANDIDVLQHDQALENQWRAALDISNADWIANTENGQAIFDAMSAAVKNASGM